MIGKRPAPSFAKNSVSRTVRAMKIAPTTE
jgi:hypothetical protein